MHLAACCRLLAAQHALATHSTGCCPLCVRRLGELQQGVKGAAAAKTAADITVLGSALRCGCMGSRPALVIHPLLRVSPCPPPSPPTVLPGRPPACSTYLLAGFFGASMYGDQTSSNVLENEWLPGLGTFVLNMVSRGAVPARGMRCLLGGQAWPGNNVPAHPTTPARHPGPCLQLVTLYLVISVPPIVFANVHTVRHWVERASRGRTKALARWLQQFIRQAALGSLSRGTHPSRGPPHPPASRPVFPQLSSAVPSRLCLQHPARAGRVPGGLAGRPRPVGHRPHLHRRNLCVHG